MGSERQFLYIRLSFGLCDFGCFDDGMVIACRLATEDGFLRGVVHKYLDLRCVQRCRDCS